MHLGGMFVKIGESVLKAHEEVALLEKTGRHERAEQLILSAHTASKLFGLFPALGYTGDIGSVDIVAPVGDVLENLGLVVDDGHGAGVVFRPCNGHAPLVNYGRAGHSSGVEKAAERVEQEYRQCLILLEQAFGFSVRLEEFEEYFFRCLHGFSLQSLLIYRMCM